MHFKAISVFCLLALMAHIHAVSFPDDWTYVAEIQIDGTQIGASQTNFPILIREGQLPAEMLNANGIHDAFADARDIRFSSNLDGSGQLACEIVEFTTGGTPLVEIWVRLNNLNNAGVNSIYVWWGVDTPAPAANSTYGSENVWTNNFIAVYHLNETSSGAANHYKDSTGNFNSLATANPPSRNPGTIGYAATFNAGDNEEIVLPNTLDTTGNYTLQGWVSTTDMSGFRSWLGKSDDFPQADSRWRFYNTTGGTSIPGIGHGGSEAQWPGGAYNYTATPGHYNMVITAGNAELIHNGTSYGTRAFTQGTDANARVTIGNSETEYWTGTIDEVRFVSTNRSVAWIAAEHLNQSDPNTFFLTDSTTPILNLDRYWIGVNTNWNDTDNWASVSGGPGGFSVPDIATQVFFDGNTPQSAISNTTINAYSIEVTNAAHSITANGQDISVATDFLLGPGTLNNTNGTINLGGNLNISTGSINVANGVLNTTGTNTQVLTLNGGTLHDVNINGTGGVNLNSNTVINGNTTITNSGLGSNNTITFNGDLTINNNLNFATATTIFGGNTTISGNTIPSFNSITVNNTASVFNLISANANTVNINGLFVNNGQLYAGVDFIDFSTANITGHGGGQDAGGTATVEDNGRTLFQSGNTWKKIDFSYTHTANTRLYFDFYSDVQGEIQAMGIENDDGITSANNFRVFGTQNWGRDFETYNAGDGWVHYEIPSGAFITGLRPFLTFVNDHDTAPQNGQSRFRNVRVVENPIPEIVVTIGDTGTLSGNGAIHGSVSISNSGAIRPGNSSSEELSIIYGNNTGLTLNQDSELYFDLGTNSDRVSLIGANSNLILDGQLHVTNSGGLAAGLYPLFSCLGTITNNDLEIVSMPTGFLGQIQLSTVGNVNYVYLDVILGDINIVWDDTNDTNDRGWALGVMIAGAQSAPQAWSIRNDSTVSVDLDIGVAPSTGAGWTSELIAGHDQFVIDVDTNFDGNEDVTLDINQSLRTALPVSDVHQFNTWFTCPTSSSSGVQQNIAITITATMN